MVERSLRDPGSDSRTERRVWESAFRALAVVVVHTGSSASSTRTVESRWWRSIRPKPATADILLPQVRALGAAVAAAGAERWARRPAWATVSASRGTPVRGRGAIVVVSDAALLLRAVAWPQLAGGRLFVTDPAGVIWSGCETAPVAARPRQRRARPSRAHAAVPTAGRHGSGAAGAVPADALRVSEPALGRRGMVGHLDRVGPACPGARARRSFADVTTAVSAAVVVAAIGLIRSAKSGGPSSWRTSCATRRRWRNRARWRINWCAPTARSRSA